LQRARKGIFADVEGKIPKEPALGSNNVDGPPEGSGFKAVGIPLWPGGGPRPAQDWQFLQNKPENKNLVGPGHEENMKKPNRTG